MSCSPYGNSAVFLSTMSAFLYLSVLAMHYRLIKTLHGTDIAPATAPTDMSNFTVLWHTCDNCFAAFLVTAFWHLTFPLFLFCHCRCFTFETQVKYYEADLVVHWPSPVQSDSLICHFFLLFSFFAAVSSPLPQVAPNWRPNITQLLLLDDEPVTFVFAPFHSLLHIFITAIWAAILSIVTDVFYLFW